MKRSMSSDEESDVDYDLNNRYKKKSKNTKTAVKKFDMRNYIDMNIEKDNLIIQRLDKKEIKKEILDAIVNKNYMMIRFLKDYHIGLVDYDDGTQSICVYYRKEKYITVITNESSEKSGYIYIDEVRYYLAHLLIWTYKNIPGNRRLSVRFRSKEKRDFTTSNLSFRIVNAKDAQMPSKSVRICNKYSGKTEVYDTLAEVAAEFGIAISTVKKHVNQTTDFLGWRIYVEEFVYHVQMADEKQYMFKSLKELRKFIILYLSAYLPL